MPAPMRGCTPRALGSRWFDSEPQPRQLTLALDPVLRYVAGQQMSLTTTGTPPGEALNGVAFYLLLVLFLGSLWNKKPH